MENIGKIISYRHVPEDLVIEFLLRLPVKSLLRFKTLSKYCYNLITSSDFIYKHFRINNRTRILTDRYVQCSTRHFNEFGFTVLLYESISHHHHDLAYFRIPCYMKYILGPINGLFLIGSQNYGLALLNPATRELKTLYVPNSNLQNPSSSSCNHRFGFGFDPLTKDLKVVAFWNTKVDDGLRIDGVNMAVYSLPNDSWKHLSPPKMCNLSCLDFDAPYMNGACYWLSNNYSIVSFEFGSECLGEINGPQHIPISEYDYASLFICNYESLAMFICTYHDTNWDQEIGSIDILIMKVEGCWTKHLTLDVSLLNVLRPVGVWKNNLLLETVDEYEDGLYEGVYTTKMVIYNLTTNETKDLDIRPHRYTGDRRVFIYNESLVSLKGSSGNNKHKESGNNKSVSDPI